MLDRSLKFIQPFYSLSFYKLPIDIQQHLPPRLLCVHFFARIHVSSILPLQRRKILLYDNSIVVKKVVEQIETLVDVSILVGNSRCPNYAQTLLSALILVSMTGSGVMRMQAHGHSFQADGWVNLTKLEGSCVVTH